jgi:uncharacterized protein YdhG (YjbR/CyaY superfamily)
LIKEIVSERLEKELQMSPKKEAGGSSGKVREEIEKLELFSEEERAAMREHAAEQKAAARRSSHANKAAEEEQAVVDKIAELLEPDRSMAMRLHTLIKAEAPVLAPRLWYGMPAYAKDGKVVCFFQSAQKFKTRYSTFGFSDAANLDDGDLWPVSYALKTLNAGEEARILALVKQAVG